MARGWHYTKLTLSSALINIVWHVFCVLCYCSFLFIVFVLILVFYALVGAS